MKKTVKIDIRLDLPTKELLRYLAARSPHKTISAYIDCLIWETTLKQMKFDQELRSKYDELFLKGV